MPYPKQHAGLGGIHKGPPGGQGNLNLFGQGPEAQAFRKQFQPYETSAPAFGGSPRNYSLRSILPPPAVNFSILQKEPHEVGPGSSGGSLYHPPPQNNLPETIAELLRKRQYDQLRQSAAEAMGFTPQTPKSKRGTKIFVPQVEFRPEPTRWNPDRLQPIGYL